VFVPIERFFALHRQKIFRKEIAVDLGYYFLNGLLPGLMLGPPISVAVLAIHQVVPGGVVAAIAGWPIWLKACATMAVGETAYYWAHRLSHQFRSSGGSTPSITARSRWISSSIPACIQSIWCGRGWPC
jgi:sterol desaturase/sphingolipid hydroxylase (fatty acid hydroxylase superfamily)